MYRRVFRRHTLKKQANKQISNNEHEWAPIKCLNALQHSRTQKLFSHFFKILQKYYQLPILCTLDVTGHFYKNNNASFLKLWWLSAYNNWTPSVTLFVRFCKGIAILLHWVHWECLIMPINNDGITFLETLIPKVLKPTGRKLWL